MNLPPDEIHVWLAFDDELRDGGLPADYETMLDPGEQERLARLQLEPVRRQFLITRALQRTVLASYMPGVSPRDLRFVVSPRGKPSLAADFAAMNLHFNVAHTQGLVAIALCREAALGIDVEKLSGRTAAVIIANRYFTAEEARELSRLPRDGQLSRFYALWTLKESWLKATGLGISAGLGNASFAFGGDHLATRVDFADDDARQWEFWQSRPTAGHVLALARCHAAHRKPGASASRARMWRWVSGKPGGEALAPPTASGQEQRAES